MTRGVKGRHEFEPLSHAVLGACIDVQRHLGVHCREVDYHRALEEALRDRKLKYEREVEVPVAHGSKVVATLRVDFRVWDDRDEPLLEAKVKPRLLRQDGEQCLRYLQQGCYGICLLVNLGQKPIGRRRFVYTPPEDTRR